jgi:hypothetical protein
MPETLPASPTKELTSQSSQLSAYASISEAESRSSTTQSPAESLSQNHIMALSGESNLRLPNIQSKKETHRNPIHVVEVQEASNLATLRKSVSRKLSQRVLAT